MTSRRIKVMDYALRMECDASPGHGYVTELPSPYRPLFKILKAKRVRGIDYSKFKINSIFLGQHAQWIDLTKGPVSAEKLFKIDMPMEALQPVLQLTVSFTNTSKKKQRFAVDFVGKMLR
jgi:hypothetical protein